MARMPKKAKADAPKREVAPILKTPIQFSPEDIAALTFKDMESGTRFYDRVADELKTRVDAVFAHYGITPSGDGSEMQLILQMAADLFPKGFKFLRGDKKSKGRGRERSIADQVNLYVVMQGFIDGGNEVQAAASFVKDKFPDISKGNSVDSIKARFSEARKTVERINRGEITESEFP